MSTQDLLVPNSFKLYTKPHQLLVGSIDFKTSSVYASQGIVIVNALAYGLKDGFYLGEATVLASSVTKEDAYICRIAFKVVAGAITVVNPIVNAGLASVDNRRVSDADLVLTVPGGIPTAGATFTTEPHWKRDTVNQITILCGESGIDIQCVGSYSITWVGA